MRCILNMWEHDMNKEIEFSNRVYGTGAEIITIEKFARTEKHAYPKISVVSGSGSEERKANVIPFHGSREYIMEIIESAVAGTREEILKTSEVVTTVVWCLTPVENGKNWSTAIAVLSVPALKDDVEVTLSYK